MADQFTYTKLPSDPCLTQEQMLAYIDGKLSVADQHACEKHLLDCAMCEDALEGLTLVKDRAVLSAPLQKDEVKQEPKVIPLHSGSSNRKMWYAAAAVAVVVITSVFFLNRFTGADMEVAQNRVMDSAVDLNAPVSAEKLDVQSDADQNKDVRNAPTDRLENFGEIVVAEESQNAEMNSPAPPDVNFELAPEEPLFDLKQPATDNNNKYSEDIFVSKPAPKQSKEEEETKDELQEQEQTEQPAEEEKKNQFWERAKVAVPIGGIQNNRDDRTTLSDDSKKAEVTAPTVAENNGPVAQTQTATDSGTGNSGEINLELSYQNGLNMLNAGQANSAIVLFDQVLQDKTHPRYEDAEFQKANALIKANRKPEAKILLQAIEAKKGIHAAEATELLKTL